MKVYRMMAALLSAAMLTAAPAVYAEDAQTPATQAADGQEQTASSADESGAEKNTNQAESGKQSGSEKQSEGADASGKTALPETNGLPAAGSSAEGTRPSYKASDYVKIGDDQYKTMALQSVSGGQISAGTSGLCDRKPFLHLQAVCGYVRDGFRGLPKYLPRNG